MSMYENAAALLGWRVLRFTPAQQWTAAAITAIAEAARAAADWSRQLTRWRHGLDDLRRTEALLARREEWAAEAITYEEYLRRKALSDQSGQLDTLDQPQDQQQ